MQKHCGGSPEHASQHKHEAMLAIATPDAQHIIKCLCEQQISGQTVMWKAVHFQESKKDTHTHHCFAGFPEQPYPALKCTSFGVHESVSAPLMCRKLLRCMKPVILSKMVRALSSNFGFPAFRLPGASSGPHKSQATAACSA